MCGCTVSSPGEIRTPVRGAKALYPRPLDDRAPTTIHTPTPQKHIKPHTPTQSQPPQGKNIEGVTHRNLKQTPHKESNPKNAPPRSDSKKKHRQFQKKPRPNHTPTQRKGGRGGSYIGTRTNPPTTKGTRKRPRSPSIHTKRGTNACQKHHPHTRKTPSHRTVNPRFARSVEPRNIYGR